MISRLRMVPAALVLGMALGLAAAPALAKKDGEGHGKGKQKHAKHEKHEKHFNHEKRVHVLSYYDEEFRGGRCPPGLAKKNNGCMPPGQAKKWRIGRALPQSVAVYEVPPALVARIGAPPAGYRYVRAGPDILLISARNRVVADVIVGLGRS
jgi:Ni/Co efflux regulator RcnB